MNRTEGLEGAVTCSTRLSRVEGEEGRLSYAGYDIEELALHATFEDVSHLLWTGSLPGPVEAERLRARFLAESHVDDRILEIGRSLSGGSHPLAVLRTLVSAAGCTDPDGADTSTETERRKVVRLTASAFTATAAIGRFRNGRGSLRPRRDPGLAANLLYMLHGEEPDASHARALEAALVLHADHGMNASTFAARVAATTATDMHAAVVAAMGALAGPLHGGANEQVMRMLLEIEKPERAAGWVRSRLADGQRIMGFGHHEYRTVDPRVPVLESLLREAERASGETNWADTVSAVRDAVASEMEARGRALHPNVDLLSAPLFHVLGFPAELFPCLFACGRMPGWTAHIMEQRESRRPIRPGIEYMGPQHRNMESMAGRT